MVTYIIDLWIYIIKTSDWLVMSMYHFGKVAGVLTNSYLLVLLINENRYKTLFTKDYTRILYKSYNLQF